ncbi:DUF2612 domain-containing protein [Agarivorans sp. B2Z047]|uniref:DUF2612 domain-containing protein n=1 Tax=Agarivorans sp. B2Z047 TaxID=2652721 RepID=UPI00128D7938|nr:DUF2612 domain-containing protein [Agarivorans sp. B2Z047]MPW31990.1 DUF2612 domain-containing protein [Agarivorans sp. B2Z047]UQN41862.1 DUF2612 domain-containing protein [Agarivorans sp. B2Z047]
MVFGPIDFSQYELDQQDEACENHLAVFRRSPIMMAFRQALIKQSQELYDTNINALLARTIEDGVGYQLDVIGQIVGQRRIPLGDARPWLTFDDETTVVDGSPVWLEGQVGGDETADDEEYRALIKSKIFKNHVKYGSIPELIEFTRLVFNAPISIRKLGNDDINLIITQLFPEEYLELLFSVIDDEASDRQYFLPIPTGCRILGAEFAPTPAFRPDNDTAGPDLGLLSVSIGGFE